MKSIIALPAIIGLATLGLVGCNQSSPSDSTETSSPNSSMHANDMMGGTNNMSPTNTMPNMNMTASNKTSSADNDATR